MVNNKKCPYCQHNIPFRQLREYVLWGAAHSIKCENCGRALHPKKYPLTFKRGFIFSFLFTIISMNIMLYILDLGFFEAVLYYLPMVITILLISIIVTVKTIEFK